MANPGADKATAPSERWTTTLRTALLTRRAIPTAKLTRNPARSTSSSCRRRAAEKNRTRNAMISMAASGSHRTGANL
jgi:hypothetical protein